MRSEAQPRIVLVTHPRDGADAFARDLVERALAACVNLIPVQSIYRWKGAVEEDPETLLVIKTTAARLPALEDALTERHPYDVPECIALAPDRVEPGYLAWLCAETEAGPDG